MTGIDRLTPISPASTAAVLTGSSARAQAGAVMGEIGHRVLAWVGQNAGAADQGAQAWTEATGSASAFRPSPAELARGGDVYDLGGLSRDIAGRLGGTPAQEGALHRALADFTRASVVQLAGLSGASGDRQVAGIHEALEAGVAATGGEGVDGVIDRVETATASLTRQNGL
jgi:hypothetical protein